MKRYDKDPSIPVRVLTAAAIGAAGLSLAACNDGEPERQWTYSYTIEADSPTVSTLLDVCDTTPVAKNEDLTTFAHKNGVPASEVNVGDTYFFPCNVKAAEK